MDIYIINHNERGDDCGGGPYRHRYFTSQESAQEVLSSIKFSEEDHLYEIIKLEEFQRGK